MFVYVCYANGSIPVSNRVMNTRLVQGSLALILQATMQETVLVPVTGLRLRSQSPILSLPQGERGFKYMICHY